MSMEVVIGPATPGPDQKRQVTVNVSFTDPTNTHGDAIHAKIVLDKIEHETPEDLTERAAKRAQELADQISKAAGTGNYRTRP